MRPAFRSILFAVRDASRVSPGALRKLFFPWATYFLPGFHPWNYDDRALIRKYEGDYADALMAAHSSAPELAAA